MEKIVYKFIKRPIQVVKNFYHLRQAKIAQHKYGNPEKYLKLLAVTGTDGKTTTTAILQHILSFAGFRTGVISTTSAKIGNKEIETGLHVTSPDPWEVPKYLKAMVNEVCEFAILETTSQGLDQNRFGDSKFTGAIITNIREDHLDYHYDWESYATAKFKIAKKLKPGAVLVLNEEDQRSADWIKNRLPKLKNNLQIKWSSLKLVDKLQLQFMQIGFNYKGVKFTIPTFGAMYNVLNILQAIRLCEQFVAIDQIAEGLKTFKLPSGRMEVMSVDPVKIVVDFAHTPAALELSLQALKNVLPAQAKIITVFGCAGKRDKGRRRMGEVSAQFSDLTILTAEDPRGETVAQINKEILAMASTENPLVISKFLSHEDYSLTNIGEIQAQITAANKESRPPFVLFDENAISSRKDAIDLALKLARPGDCVIITGKGHEKSLAFGREEKEVSWSDQVEVKRILNKKKR